jgi:hypothetical protein
MTRCPDCENGWADVGYCQAIGRHYKIPCPKCGGTGEVLEKGVCTVCFGDPKRYLESWGEKCKGCQGTGEER